MEVSNLSLHLAFWLASKSLHSLYSVLARSKLYQLFLLFSKRLCCLNFFAALPPCTRLYQELGNVYFVFFVFLCFQVSWDKVGLANEYASLWVFPKIKKNVYEEGKKIVKTEAVFSLSLNQITKILCFAVVTIYKYGNKLTVISKIYCISKLLAELGLSNSKSKTNSEATHSIEEIIPANISYC